LKIFESLFDLCGVAPTEPLACGANLLQSKLRPPPTREHSLKPRRHTTTNQSPGSDGAAGYGNGGGCGEAG
jgi:hypothetical protein